MLCGKIMAGIALSRKSDYMKIIGAKKYSPVLTKSRALKKNHKK